MAELRRGGIVVLRGDDGSRRPGDRRRILRPTRPAAPAGAGPGGAGAGHHPPPRRGDRHGDPAAYRRRHGRHQQADHPRPARGRAGRHHPAAARKRSRPAGTSRCSHLSRPVASHAPRVAETAIELAKLARLLPAVVLGPLSRDPGNKRRDWAREQDLLYVEAADIAAYEETAARNLQQVAQAHVPLEGAENARILAWRPSDGGKEHLAIVVGEIDPTEPVLIRLHSECFTGDLLGSLRCDCGVQLRGAIDADRQAGLGRAALSRAGRPRHRPGQQAARLRAAGRRLRHDRRQRAARLRRRRAHLRAGRDDAARAWASSGCG